MFDLGYVDMSDSTGLAVLMRSYCNARQHGGLVCLAAPTAFIHHLLDTKQLDTYFPVLDERPHALAWLTSRQLRLDLADSQAGHTSPGAGLLE